MLLQFEDIAQKAAAYFKNEPVDRVYIFGSYANGDATEESDIDILLDLSKEHGIGLFKFAGMQIDLSELLEKKVDLVTTDGLSKYIAPYIHASKKLIYERRAGQ